jgi:glycyl-tRNA synthetase (class II)
MDLKETIDSILGRFSEHKEIKSVAYGDISAYDESKQGLLYPRAYLSLEEATRYRIVLTLTVTDKVFTDLSNRLDIQSETFSIIQDLTLELAHLFKTTYSPEYTFTPTGLFERDSTEGWQTQIEVFIEQSGTCDSFENPIITN